MYFLIFFFLNIAYPQIYIFLPQNYFRSEFNKIDTSYKILKWATFNPSITEVQILNRMGKEDSKVLYLLITGPAGIKKYLDNIKYFIILPENKEESQKKNGQDIAVLKITSNISQGNQWNFMS